MTTVRETSLEALATALTSVFDTKFLRDPEKTPDEQPDGLIIMRDGDPGAPDITLSPIRYQFTHPVPLEFSTSGQDRTAKLDALLLQLDTMLVGNRTLSGAVIDARVMDAPLIEEIDIEGATTTRAASVHVLLIYVSTSPIG